MVREKSGKSQGILLYSNCGHPEIVSSQPHMADRVYSNMTLTFFPLSV